MNTLTPGFKTFSMLHSIEHEIYHAYRFKMPTIVGILTFISMLNTTSESLKVGKVYFLPFSFYEQLFHAHFIWAWKKFYNPGGLVGQKEFDLVIWTLKL